MGEGSWLLLFLTVQRLAELAFARRNTAQLIQAGAVEHGRTHYPFMVALHAVWLGGLWLLGRDSDVDPVLLLVFVALQALRIWVIATLGVRWTTRIVVLPGAPLIAGGPYRFLRHPNYWIVAGEIAIIPLALGLPVFALVFFLLNALMLAVRIRAEDAALSGRVL